MPVDRRGTLVALCVFGELELELELIQSNMAQKPMLRSEVGCACVAREVYLACLSFGDKSWLGADYHQKRRIPVNKKGQAP